MATSEHIPTDERGEILRMLAEQRQLLLITVRGLNDEQAARRTTVSELTLGGLLKHICQGERVWTHIMTERTGETPPGMWDMDQHRMVPGETLSGLLEDYTAVTRATDEAIIALPNLDQTARLPVFPWDPTTVSWWSARRILLNLLREMAQHAGHADIIREALDGANTTMQRAG